MVDAIPKDLNKEELALLASVLIVTSFHSSSMVTSAKLTRVRHKINKLMPLMDKSFPGSGNTSSENSYRLLIRILGLQ